MKNSLGLLLCMVMLISPAFANTVKENNYSEELNTQVVSDYVNKRIKVNYSEVNVPGGDSISNEEKIEIKKRVIADHQAKMAYYNKYFTLKLQDLSNSLQRVQSSANSRSAEDQAAIIALHQKNINETIEQRNAVIAIIQAEIDKTQADIESLQIK